MSLKNANDYLALAKSSEQPLKSEYLLKAAIIFTENHQNLKAQETLSIIKLSALSPLLQDSYHLYYAISVLRLENSEIAMQFLNKIKSPQLQNIEWQVTYQETLADTYVANHNYLESAVVRIKLEDLLLHEEQLRNNHQQIWLALGQLNPEFLSNFSSDIDDPILKGWLDLVSLKQSLSTQPKELIAALNLWKNKFPLHPASQYMPEELEKVASAKIYNPKKIALLLPLSGQLSTGGKILRDGFLAAHYSQAFASEREVTIYDTAQSLSALTTYQKAIDDGADFIVGPLTKEALLEIASQEALSIPQLSLNQIADLPHHPEFYQFGLPIEDEAKQIAEMAVLKGHQKAIIIAPKSEIGQRSAEAFQTHFSSLEGEVAKTDWFENSEQMKSTVQKVLNIDKSERRISLLQQVLGSSFETQQRRRQDADMVFLVATATEARRIKPFLNYYFAHDLPIYSTSRINSGDDNAQLNKDLNDIIFTESPFMLADGNSSHYSKKELSKLLPSIESSLGRLFALGYDAYQIIPNLNILQALEQFQPSGLSGSISVTKTGEVKRTLSVAQFKQGIARELVQSKN